MKKTYSTPEMEELVINNALLTDAILNSTVDIDTGDEWSAINP